MAEGLGVSAFDPVVKEIEITGFEALSALIRFRSVWQGLTVHRRDRMGGIQSVNARGLHRAYGRPVLVDARRIFNPQKFRGRLEYIVVGLGDDPLQ